MGLRTVFYFIGSLFLITSCGLKYVPTETPVAFMERRHAAVENYVRTEMGDLGTNYRSVAFGQTRTVKPFSYRTLDSLYAIKYKFEHDGKKDAELDSKIEQQRLVALNDTNKVLYIEDHVFSIGSGDTLEIYSAYFQMHEDLKIEDVKLKESVFLPKKYGELYKQFLFEESFLDPGNLATGEELNFYAYFKSGLSGLTGTARDKFIIHILDLMQSANKIKTLDTYSLLKMQARKKILGSSYTNSNEKFSELQETVSVGFDSKEEVSGYTFTYSHTVKAEQMTTSIYTMVFDRYLQLVSATKH